MQSKFVFLSAVTLFQRSSIFTRRRRKFIACRKINTVVVKDVPFPIIRDIK